MIRLALAAGAVALSFVSVPDAEAGGRHHRYHTGHHHGPQTYAHRYRAMLPPHIPYRDPRFHPVRHASGPAYGPPLVGAPIPLRNPNVPIYNEPPPRFSPY